MKKKLFFALSILVGLLNFAQADVLECRGLDTTMKVTEVKDWNDEIYLFVQLWTAQYDHARFADLYTGSLNRRTNSIEQLTSQKTFSAKEAFGSYLKVNLQDERLEFRTNRGDIGKDRFRCKVIRIQPSNGAELGGGN